MQSPLLSGAASVLQKLSNGYRQPPRPESRSDSFARTESFLRDHSRLLSSSLSNHSNSSTNGNHVAFDLDKEGSVISTSTRYPSRPESRNQQLQTTSSSSSYHHFGLSNGIKKENNVEQQQQQNPADPLVSLIESLAEIKPLSETILTAQADRIIVNTNTNSSVNNGLAKLSHVQPLLLFDETHQQQQEQSAVVTTDLITFAGSHNATNTYAFNQLPKAWQNCTTSTQVRLYKNTRKS